jgi:hypothetical protein
MTNSQERPTWAELLHSAVHTPGKLLAAYTAFHNFSFGNALLALEQCLDRNIEPGPLNNYRGWQVLKRQVRKGEKGLSICMPVTYKKRITDVGGKAEYRDWCPTLPEQRKDGALEKRSALPVAHQDRCVQVSDELLLVVEHNVVNFFAFPVFAREGNRAALSIRSDNYVHVLRHRAALL